MSAVPREAPASTGIPADAPADAIDRLRLARAEGVGPVAYRHLVERYGDAASVLAVLPELARRAGRVLPPRIPDARAAAAEIARSTALGARLLFIGTPAYPGAVMALSDAPAVLAVAGDARLLAGPALAIVGSRNASANGRRFAETLAEGLAATGFVVVSGLARGVDAAAHLGALRGGRTVACIAGGIDVVYPPEHAALQGRIAAEGAVISEMPPGSGVTARAFPRRNRLISGLSLGVIVIEAATRSGSLITARLANEAGREVFAVPGSPLDARCAGSNALLRDGAHLVESVADVLAHLPARRVFAAEPAPVFQGAGLDAGLLRRARRAVVDLLGPTPTKVDDVIRHCGVPAAAVMSVLLDLELAGRLETLPGGRVALLVEP